MATRQNEEFLEEVVSQLELPQSAYEKAIKRYESLGEWMGREGSTCAEYDPHVFPQGSFRLGTAIKPILKDDEYDLDLACNLTKGVFASTHTQHDLKDLVGKELESYRTARGIDKKLEEKHRCWRLEYADELSFHMDIVPCIPEDEAKQNKLVVSMESAGVDRFLAESVAARAVGITDDRLPSYKILPSDWLISNPEGYAKWFESKMQVRLEIVAATEAVQVDEVPLYERKNPLQKVIQLLKRHRDVMFMNQPDSKPISVIITTLAANAYQGSHTLEDTLREVLDGLNKFVAANTDVVNNPVNPEENFADRWSMPENANLQLQHNFNSWVATVNRDFQLLLRDERTTILNEALQQSFNVSLPINKIESYLGLGAASISPSAISAPRQIIDTPARPWLNKE